MQSTFEDNLKHIPVGLHKIFASDLIKYVLDDESGKLLSSVCFLALILAALSIREFAHLFEIFLRSGSYVEAVHGDLSFGEFLH